MTFKRISAIFLVYAITCFAWTILFGVTNARTRQLPGSLRAEVDLLWGESQTQLAPTLSFRAVRPSTSEDPSSKTISQEEVESLGIVFPEPDLAAEEKKKKKLVGKTARPHGKKLSDEKRTLWAVRDDAVSVSPYSSHIDAFIHSDPRRKGLVWFALYDVDFKGAYVYKHAADHAGYLDLEFSLPTPTAIYDGLVFEVDGQDYKGALDLESGVFRVMLPVKPGSSVVLKTAYKTRGSDEWSYRPGNAVQQLENFHLNLTTDFADIDFPSGTQSPSSREREAGGWNLAWDLKSTVTGQGMGMILPRKLQPGELSSALILSAPVSLLFFFVILFVVATLQKLDIHPMNYLFISAAFFAFHLLFSYSADLLSVSWAFGLSSVVSLFLTVSYLRLVVSPKFALREAGLAQLIYLVGFSLAHFWSGFTGLTVTVLAILTLFVIMQATGRLSWSEVFRVASAKRNHQVKADVNQSVKGPQSSA